MTIRGLIVSIVMTIVLCIMTLGYAALQQRIDIQGEATVDSTYRVAITSISEGTSVGDARSTNAPQYNALTANFYVGLTNDTDYITYTIEITNYSTVDIRLNSVDLNTTNNNMKVVKIGISNGDIILAGSTKTFTVKIKLETETSSEQTSTITVIPEVTRLKGGLGSVVEEVYDAYEIGDVVSFAGSNWYVIEDSGSSQDYIVLLKQNVLTATEIGDNYSWMNSSGIGQKNMAYYWSNTCHDSDTYGNVTYSDIVNSGCSGHNDYAGSKIKEAVEKYMTNYLDASELKEIFGYKIRLIRLKELQENLGLSKTKSGSSYKFDIEQTEDWVYKDLGGAYGYWTMDSAETNNTQALRVVRNSADVSPYNIQVARLSIHAVRPVINLYKDAID